MERVTGIEPALSAWESGRSGSVTVLTWASDAPLVIVMDPATPGLMACQWPWHGTAALGAGLSLVSFTMLAVISCAAVHVSGMAIAVAPARRRSRRSA